MPAPRILLSGYYGFGNTGDEAILEAIVAELRRQRPDVRIRVLTADPARARELGLEPHPRKKPLDLVRALLGSDLLLSGGGGLVQDTTGVGSVVYYLGLVALARLLGRRAMLYCQGFGPVETPTGRRVARLLVPAADLVTMRDPESLEDLRALGVRETTWRLTADPALLLEPPDPKRMAAILAEEGLSGEVGRLEGPDGRIPGTGPLVAVAVRPWPDLPLEAIGEALAAFAEAERARFLLIPFQPDRDTEPSRALAARLGPRAVLLSRPRCPREIAGLLACVDLVVAMRLHALILAASRGVPFLGLSYDPKVERFCQRAGGLSLLLRGLAADRLAEALGHLLNGRDHQRRLLAERVGPMQEAARRAAAAALRLAEGAPRAEALAALDSSAPSA